MDNPYLPPETSARAGTQRVVANLGLDPASSAFLTAVVSLVGACTAQVAGLLPILLSPGSPAPANIRGLLWAWLAASGLAVGSGLRGGYFAFRRASVGNLPLLAFLVAYSLTARFDGVSFGWPFQLHVGMVFGRVGLGLNLVGVGMVVWRSVIQGREAARASESAHRWSAEPGTPG